MFNFLATEIGEAGNRFIVGRSENVEKFWWKSLYFTTANVLVYFSLVYDFCFLLSELEFVGTAVFENIYASQKSDSRSKKEDVRRLLQAPPGAPCGQGVCSICVCPVSSALVGLRDGWPRASLVAETKCPGPERGDWGSGLEPDLPQAFCVTSCWLPPSSSVRLRGRVSSQLAKASNRCLYQEYLCENKWEVMMENTCLALVRCSVTSGNSVCDWTYFPVKFCLGDGNWDGTEKDGSGSHREYSLHWFEVCTNQKMARRWRYWLLGFLQTVLLDEAIQSILYIALVEDSHCRLVDEKARDGNFAFVSGDLIEFFFS